MSTPQDVMLTRLAEMFSLSGYPPGMTPAQPNLPELNPMQMQPLAQPTPQAPIPVTPQGGSTPKAPQLPQGQPEDPEMEQRKKMLMLGQMMQGGGRMPTGGGQMPPAPAAPPPGGGQMVENNLANLLRYMQPMGVPFNLAEILGGYNAAG